MSRTTVLGSLSTLFLVAAAAFVAGGCSTPKGNAADGKKWYRMHNCQGCHGEKGYDGGGPDIANIDMGYGSFVKRLRNSQTAVMPEYSEEKISDQDAADILAYLKSVER